MAVIDTLKLARGLRDRAGFTQNAAEATAEALNDALGGAVASKADLDGTEARLNGRIDQLEARIDQLDQRLNARIDQLGSDRRKEMAEMKAEFLKWVVGIVGFQTVAILGGVAVLIHLVK